MKFIIPVLSLLLSLSCLSNDLMKAMQSEDVKAQFDKMSPEEREKAALVMMNMFLLDSEISKLAYSKTFTPIKLNTGKEGTSFKSKIPFVVTKRKEAPTDSYKYNSQDKVHWRVDDISRHCGGCFRAKKYPDDKLSFIFYPTESVLFIEQFIYVPGEIITILSDAQGNRFSASEYDIKDIMDGGPGSMQNEEMLFIDTLKVGTTMVTMPIKIEKLEMDYFQKGIITPDKYWDFPPLSNKRNPGLGPDDHHGWLNYAYSAYMESTSTRLDLKNFRKTEYDLAYDMTAPPQVFALLSHIGLISPYQNKEGRMDFYKVFKTRWESQMPFVLGEKVEDLFKRLKSQQPVHKPDLKEVNSMKEKAMKILAEEIKKRREDKSP